MINVTTRNIYTYTLQQQIRNTNLFDTWRTFCMMIKPFLVIVNDMSLLLDNLVIRLLNQCIYLALSV